MKILVLNCGSSSIKYQLFNMPSGVVLVKGIVEKIGSKGSFLKNERFDGDKVELDGEILDHQSGIEFDKNKNTGVRSKETIISKEGSPVTVMVVPTDEEFVIASDTRYIVEHHTV